LSDFLLWARPFKEYLEEGQDSSFYPLWLVLKELARTKVRWSVIQEEKQWKMLLSHFIGHYMQITLDNWKDEGNEQSLNPENKDKKQKVEIVVSDLVENEYMKTHYGRVFWHLYKDFGFYSMVWGIHT